MGNFIASKIAEICPHLPLPYFFLGVNLACNDCAVTFPKSKFYIVKFIK